MSDILFISEERTSMIGSIRVSIVYMFPSDLIKARTRHMLFYFFSLVSVCSISKLRLGILSLGMFPRFSSPVQFSPGLCSRSTWVPQATNFCLWVTGKTYFLHINLVLGTQEFLVRNLWAPHNFS